MVNVYSWSEYLPQEVRDRFTARTGIKINLTLYESNEMLLDKMQAGVSDFDLVVPSDYTVAILKRQNLVQKIESRRSPTGRTSTRASLAAPYDPNNEYAMPIFWDTPALATTSRPSARSTAGKRCSTRSTPARSSCSRIRGSASGRAQGDGQVAQ